MVAKILELPKKVITPIKNERSWIFRAFWLWLIMGGVYYIIEGLWRLRTNGGWANIIMLPIGGLAAVLIGIMNENPKFTGKKMLFQALYGMAVIVVIEFLAGLLMNVWLGLGVWDYSGRPMNFMGQINLAYALLWFLLTPLIIWFDDWLRNRLWKQGEKYKWHENYRKMFTFK